MTYQGNNHRDESLNGIAIWNGKEEDANARLSSEKVISQPSQ